MSRQQHDFESQTFSQACTQSGQQTELPNVSDADYEQMYHLLYEYRFGAISFLELLDKLEAILHIPASQASCQTDPD